MDHVKGNPTEEKFKNEDIVEESEVSEQAGIDDEIETSETNDIEETQLTEEDEKVILLGQQVEELNNRLLRVQADYDNFRRRTREEKEAAAKYRAQSLVEGLLPVLDNFERALMVTTENEETKSLLQGMEMVYRQLQESLKNEGVEVIETVGQSFDPHLHQAVMQVESDEFESNQVVEELQKGYKLKDRVVRPAMVKVNA
ncbi:nucleotide exchange factor GrpE [Anaerobacillus sp. MEB173]|uniref:nucleotide exchange factor GrpE n=1 Tax=Anaerobacillus sp. MEB173 TaxID=3383345 RepID=UPI003F8E88B0